MRVPSTLRGRDAHWLATYIRLRRHVEAGGVLTFDVDDETVQALTRWAASNMRAHTLGALTEQKTQLLESVPGWRWSLHEPEPEEATMSPWSVTAAELHQWAAKRRKLPQKGELAAWVHEQQQAYPDQLTERQIHTLEQIVGWRWRPPTETDVAVRRYLAFMESRGRHPRGYYQSAEEKTLSVWARKQRALYRKHEIPSEDLILFERIPGWDWEHAPR